MRLLRYLLALSGAGLVLLALVNWFSPIEPFEGQSGPMLGLGILLILGVVLSQNRRK